MDLTQLWQSISEETAELAAAVERLPDKCECGDADAHLEGRCLCCRSHGQAGNHPAIGVNCNVVLARLQADLSMLSEDLALAGPPTETAALEKVRRVVPSKATILKTCLFYAGLAAWVLAVIMAFRGEPLWAGVCAVFALGADVAGRVWSRRSPVPMPYFMRWILLLPRGPHSPKNLERVLQPRSGERILEIGPGVGVHALPVASLLLPNGVLDVLDVQQDMLDNLVRRAATSGLTNIAPKQGDARKLPYPDQTFDAAYLIGVLGEIPDPIVAMCELKRVLKPTGRLVISEILIDPDFISLSALQEKARGAGFVLEQSAGPGFAYSAVLRPATPKQIAAAGSPRSLLDARCSAVLRSRKGPTMKPNRAFRGFLK